MGVLLLLLFIISFVIYYQKKLITTRAEMINQEKEHQRNLLHSEIEIAERERRKIAADIHDDINPNMNAVKMHISRLARKSLDASEVKNIVTHSTSLLDNAMASAQNIYNNIIPPTLMRQGFVSALRSVCNDLGKSGVNIEFTANEDSIDFRQEIQVQLYRLTKEVLNNTLKHAKPSFINVRIEKVENLLNVFILHDGMGVTTETIKELAKTSKGIGLKSIFTRADIINAGVDYSIIAHGRSQVAIKIALQ